MTSRVLVMRWLIGVVYKSSIKGESLDGCCRATTTPGQGRGLDLAEI